MPEVLLCANGLVVVTHPAAAARQACHLQHVRRELHSRDLLFGPAAGRAFTLPYVLKSRDRSASVHPVSRPRTYRLSDAVCPKPARRRPLFKCREAGGWQTTQEWHVGTASGQVLRAVPRQVALPCY